MINYLRITSLVFTVVLSFNYCSTSEVSFDNGMKPLSIDSIDVLNNNSADSLAPQFDVDIAKMAQPMKTKVPNYPIELRNASIEGTVWVRIWVTKTGSVRRATIMFSTDHRFNKSSLETALEWRFSPAVDKNGITKDVWVYLPFKYRIG